MDGHPTALRCCKIYFINYRDSDHAQKHATQRTLQHDGFCSRHDTARSDNYYNTKHLNTHGDIARQTERYILQAFLAI